MILISSWQPGTGSRPGTLYQTEMKKIILVLTISRVFSLDTVGITKQELKVASENSRKLADELTGIVEALKAELEQEKSEGQREREGRRLSGISDNTEDLAHEDDDKVENVLLQFQINKLEQEINKLTLTAVEEGTSSDQQVKTNTTKSNNRKKYRRMLARFYYGDHYVALE